MIEIKRNTLHYGLSIESLQKHLFRVSLKWVAGEAGPVVIAMPAWAPGSYMIRNFARHVQRIEAFQGAVQLPLRKRDKDAWELEVAPGVIELNYSVYAADPSVRAAYLDNLRGFVNGPAIFMRPLGLESWCCELDLQPGSAPAGWLPHTTLPEVAVESGYGLYRVENYHALIDYPIELADCEVLGFEVAAVPHQIVLSGIYPEFDRQRLIDDVRAICAVHVQRFHADKQPPFSRYVFFLNITNGSYGGLEHRDSTALVCSVADLPALAMGGSPTAKYQQLLGLFSHEYFHVWNVKRIAPAGLQEPDYQREVHTELLWSFEGFTSYFDDYTVFLAGCVSEQGYLRALAEIASRVHRGAGRGLQSVAESSFDAWTRFYLQDANSPNAIVSYYAKGALLALCLDLRLRLLTDGVITLDDVMRKLWQRYCATGSGLAENEIQEVVQVCMADGGYHAQGASLVLELDGWVHTTCDLPLDELLNRFGVDLQWRSPATLGDKGGVAAPVELSVWLAADVVAMPEGLKLSTVRADGAAEVAGLMAGDLVVALAGRKVTLMHLEACMAEALPGQIVKLHYFRDSVLQETLVCWQAPPSDRAELRLSTDAGLSKVARGWLGQGSD